MEAEVSEINTNNLWGQVYAQIRRDSINHDHTTIEASKPENRHLNRYRDVYPYDHSRIVIWDCDDTDYINASLVQVPKANRKYILAQGPLPSTVGHFWMAVWQRKCKAVLMLNKIIEKGQIKCHQYWPINVGDTLEMPNVYLSLTHEDSKTGQHFTVRTFKLTNLKTNESREILHFHYTNWPDFCIPQSPDSFLEFLHAVRDSGSLDEDVGPAVVHCSAGIGRSGTFCLVDTCLVLLANDGPESVCVKDILLELRNYRMGLIQTVDQLKFSYMAIVEGARQHGFLPKDALSDLTGPKPPPQRQSDTSSSSDDDDDDDVQDDTEDDEDDEDDLAPPLPPRRSESLLKSNFYNNGTQEQVQQDSNPALNADLPAVILLQEQVNGSNECSTSSSENTPPDKNGQNYSNSGGHQKLTSSVSAPLQDFKTDFFSDLQTSSKDSPTKCILNNHKMEERKREMELRRRKKEEKNRALEAQVQEMKRKAKESEDWSRKKNFLFEKMVPFCVGLAMLVVGTVYYMRS